MFLFIVFSIFTLAHAAYVAATSDKLIAALTNYFKCEALGHVPGKCNRSEFEQYYNPYLSVISYALLGLVPLGIVNSVLKWRSVKEVVVTTFCQLTKKSSKNAPLSNFSSGKSGPGGVNEHPHAISIKTNTNE